MIKIQSLIRLLKSTFHYSSSDWEKFHNHASPLGVELLNYALESPNLSDEEAARVLLKTDLKDPNFGRIKTRLRDKLFMEVLKFSPAPSKFTAYQRNYYRDQRLFTVFKILRGLNQIDLCKYIATKLFRRSKTYHFTENRLETSKYLFKYYSSIKPNVQLANEFKAEFRTSKNSLSLENDLEYEYYSLFLHILNGTASESNYLKVLDYLNHQSEYIGIDSSRFHLFYFRLKELIYIGLGDYLSAIDTAGKGLYFFENLKYEHTAGKRIFLGALANAYIKMGFHTEAEQTIVKNLTLVSDKKPQWFSLKKIHLELQLKKLELNQAFLTFCELINTKKQKSLPESIDTFINQCSLLFFFLSLNEKIDSEYILSSKKVNSLFKILKSRESESRYFSMVLYILFRIQKHKTVSLESWNEHVIEITNQRLVKKIPHYRSICFLKLLLLVPKNDYHPEATKRKSQHLRNALRDSITSLDSENEIISYGVLWEVIMAHLKRQQASKIFE